jgi:hypothetical protein
MAEQKAHQHSGYVQVAGKGDDAVFFGICMVCAWQGQDRKSSPEAQVDVNDHVATTGIALRDVGA